MDTSEQGLVAQIEERFLIELAREPGIDPQLIEELARMAQAGEIRTEALLLQLFERLGAQAS